jgi:hypothetical protein
VLLLFVPRRVSDFQLTVKWMSRRNESSEDVPFRMNHLLRWLAMVLSVIAALGIALLLATDAKIHVPLAFSASAISAASLLLIGVSFLLVQAIQRPSLIELLKNALLAGAFLLWGVVQLMRQSDLSKKLGDVVIALYVVDLAWVVFATLNTKREARPAAAKQ